MITDYSMPGMNGAELGKAARTLFPNLPIIVASGYADLPPGSGIDLPRLGKPYSQAQLAAEIGKLFVAQSAPDGSGGIIRLPGGLFKNAV